MHFLFSCNMSSGVISCNLYPASSYYEFIECINVVFAAGGAIEACCCPFVKPMARVFVPGISDAGDGSGALCTTRA